MEPSLTHWRLDEPLSTLEAVRSHLYERRDDLRRCVIGFSGGKEACVLATLVRELVPDIPLWYAWTGECEWPAHLEYILSFGGVRLIRTKVHGYDWFDVNPWAFLPRQGSRESNQLSRVWHRDPLRRLARDEGKILLWGNRLRDRNNVPAVRFAARGTRLWMPLRDLTTADIVAAFPRERWSPIYRHTTGIKSDTAPTRHARPQITAAAIREDARQYLPPRAFTRWDHLFREKRLDAVAK